MKKRLIKSSISFIAFLFSLNVQAQTWNIPTAGSTTATYLGITSILNHDLPIYTNNAERLRISSSGNVGIGTGATISSRLHVTGGAVLFSGTTGSTPVSGAGTRMMWIPAKGAFRAGTVFGPSWDDANIGNSSFAFGVSSNASGGNSFAVGYSVLASGGGSFSMGTYSTASASNSFAIGNGYNSMSGPVNLTNNIANSLMIGFNSGVPTLFVSPPLTQGGTGTVAIATTTIPTAGPAGGYKFVVAGNSNINGSMVIGDPSTITSGTPFPTDYKLFVTDGILTEKVKVAVKTTSDWADYVFAPTYKLMPLVEVEKFINKNQHLPEVPSAEAMVNNGLDVAAMDAKLLQKIEEVTLYLIEMKKENERLNKELEALKKSVELIKQ